MLPNSFESSVPPITRITIVGWALGSFLATYAAPFGTLQYPFELRAIFWSIVVVGATLMARSAMWVVWHFMPTAKGFIVDAAVSVLMVLFYTPVLYFSAIVIFDGRPLISSTYLTFMQYVAIISIAVCITRRMVAGLIGQRNASLTEQLADNQSETQPRLIRRLPKGFDGQILRLTVEDHFVDVVAESGTYRIRLRFADAVNEMDPCPGSCTHRSHWVATHAVTGVRREAGKIWLEITNGDLVPVSRKYRPDVEAAGLL